MSNLIMRMSDLIMCAYCSQRAPTYAQIKHLTGCENVTGEHAAMMAARHPVAKEYEQLQAEHRERQDKLMALWRAAWAYEQGKGSGDLDAVVQSLGPPPDTAAAPEGR